MSTFYLEVDDEITSAAARIRGAEENRVALVLPVGSRVATSRINFRLLAREAQQSGRRLAIVAAEPGVQSLARSAGLPVFSTTAEYDTAEAARPAGGATEAVAAALDELASTVDTIGPGSRAARAAAGSGTGRSPRRRLGVRGYALLALAALLTIGGGIGAYLFLPSTTIVLTLREDPIGPLSLTVRVDPAAAVPDDATSTVPGQTRTFELEQSGSFEATGENVEEEWATGTVTFYSQSFFPVNVPAGTEVSTTSGVAFATTIAVDVPNYDFGSNTRGQKDAPIKAVVKGTSGNVAAGSIVKLPAPLAAIGLSVKNAEPTSGGSRTVTKYVQQSDLDRAKSNLTTRLSLEFASVLAAPNVVPAGVALFPETAKLGNPAYAPDPTTLLNAEQDTFELAADAAGTATVASLSSVESLAGREIESRVTVGHSLVTGSVSVVLGTPAVDGAVVTVPVTAEALEAPWVDVDRLRAAVKGKSVQEARAYLSQYGTVEISVSPGWTSSVSNYDFRISLKVVTPTLHPSQPAASSSAAAGSPSPSASPTGAGDS
jgi:hypothetical protein